MKLVIKRSRIAGHGVFAGKNIKRGTRICFLKGERMSLDEMIERVDSGHEEGSDPLGIGDELYLDLTEQARTFNHSCDPNAYIRGENELVAIHDIRTGEEIMYDYSTTMNDNARKLHRLGHELWTCKCRCGSKNCRGIIDQFKTLPKARQRFYVKNKFAPDFVLKRFRPKFK